MLLHLLGVTLLAVFATAENKDIKIECKPDSVNITWIISEELVPYSTYLFLGNCIRSDATILPTGEWALHFHYKFRDCKFKKKIKGKHLIYQNVMTYKPGPKSQPPLYEYFFECVQKRPKGWIPPFLNPGASVSVGHGGLVFHMALLNEQMTGIAKSNVIPLGSVMPIWAAVEQKAHQPLRLFMEECVAAPTAEPEPHQQVHPIIVNKGCLIESNSVFVPRYHSSALVLSLQSSMLGTGKLYIHCKLVAWDPEVLDESKKACQYSKQNEGWELLDDPSQNSRCSCCDQICKTRTRRRAKQKFHGLSQLSVLGPLVIVDRSERQHNSMQQALCSVMMASIWHSALLFSLAAVVAVFADVKLDCRPDFVTLVWRESRHHVDTSLFRLGSCAPISASAREATFRVEYKDCNFRTMVTGDKVVHTNDLIYLSPDSGVQTLTHPAICVFDRPKEWAPTSYDPVFSTYGQSGLVFHMALMNEDFTGPAASTRFALGSFIPIVARVEEKMHQPLLLLIEECIATTTPERQSDYYYNIIGNKGCLLDSKMSQSRFEQRLISSEVRLSLQAFRFAVEEEVFIHCKLVAWDPSGIDHTKKACNFLKGQGWELVDNLAHSKLCDCCETSCKSRWSRSVASGKHGIVQNAVLGPLTIPEV
ncbi:zona pellucida glycoprotein 3f, tandem duplicate 2 [Syngnathus scovelli]|uniref:zona pellucida glycoprotein 3f, tandem duplicate 2 n=1 Tax=Syngnathus scovelli TaxID=161590 RepID=UPI0035CA51C0